MESEWNDYDEKVKFSYILYYAKLMLSVRLLFRSVSLTSRVGGIEHERLLELYCKCNCTKMPLQATCTNEIKLDFKIKPT